MYYTACNITEFVLKLEQKLFIESRLKRKLVCKMLLPFNMSCKYFRFCNNVLYFIFYGFLFDYTIFCIILVLPLLNSFFLFPFQNVRKCIAKCGNVVNIPKSFCK